MKVVMPRYQDAPREPVDAPVFKVFRLAAVIGLHLALLAWLAHTPHALLTSPPVARITRMDVRVVQSATAPLALIAPPKPVAQPSRPNPSAVPSVRRAPQPDGAPVQAAVPDGWSAAESFESAAHATAPAKQDASAAPLSPPITVGTPARFDAGYLQNPAPAYPSMSKRLHEEGTVLLLVFVSSNGDAERVRIKQGSGYSRLDEVAVKTVQQWRFVPARQGTETVAASIVVPIVFRLES